MAHHLDITSLTPGVRIAGEDAAETRLLRQMLRSATKYIRGFRWCPPIDKAYLGCGIGGVVAVFLFHFRKRIERTDEWLWVIEGDLPSAYLVTDQAKDPASALQQYCKLMDHWVRAVMEARSLEEVFPVAAAPTVENAKALKKRLAFVRRHILPLWRARSSVK